MDRDFWLARWRENRIGFHQDIVNPHLQAFLPKLGLNAGARVFVPLCGKSRDMIWLRDQGYRVLGVEISELAVRAFFEENAIEARVATRGAFTVFDGGDIEIACGDAFDLTRSDVADVAAVYDRAAIVAFPADMRARYARHLQAILPSAARMLAVTLEYDEREMQGPPFSVDEGELRALFAERFALTRLAAKDKLDVPGPSRYKEQGLSRLTEKVFLLSPR